ncbi:MAG: glutathione S-transferase [Deltaproteobacteria bacterium]|nr:glutathione S-transferase [Deltaproteobacteria bacterium]
MIKLHHLNNSRSQRILWLLEELELPYEIVRYQRDKVTMRAPVSLRAIHPLGKSPVLEDGANIIAESGAILEYLVDKYGQGRLKPMAGSPDELKYRFFMHYAEGSVMPPLLVKVIIEKIENAPAPFFLKPLFKGISQQVHKAYIDEQMRTNFDFIESELRRTGWLAGDQFSAADIQMSFPIEAADAKGVVGTQRKAIRSYIEKFRSRPAYMKAIQAGGPYDLNF